MGLIQDFIDSKSEPEKVKERSILREEKKKKKIKGKIIISKGVRSAFEKGGKKIVRVGERISRARVKFRKGKISKGFRVQL